MSPIDVDKVKKQYDWDPSKGDYIHKTDSRENAKNSKKFLYLVIGVIIVFGIIAYMKFF